MSDEHPPNRPETKPKPTRFHRALGALALLVFLALVTIDMLPGYTVRPALAVLLVVSFLTLLGFGHIAGELLGLYGGGGGSGGSGGGGQSGGGNSEDK